MSMMKKLIFLACALVLMTGCSTVVLKPTDFSWSYESVMTTDAQGVIKGEPKTITCSVKGLFFAEVQDSVNVADKVIRVIRDRDGFYFMTSAGFKNVYIFKTDDGALSLQKKVLISENGLNKPAFNRRDKGIELANEGVVYFLNKNGLITEK